jgi:hypothetical protein
LKKRSKKLLLMVPRLDGPEYTRGGLGRKSFLVLFFKKELPFLILRFPQHLSPFLPPRARLKLPLATGKLAALLAQIELRRHIGDHFAAYEAPEPAEHGKRFLLRAGSIAISC